MFWLVAKKKKKSFFIFEEGEVEKLIILCLVLVVVGLSVPASADPMSVTNPLKVDIDGAGTVTLQAG